MRRFLTWLWRIITSTLPVWIFFYLAFSLLRLTESVAIEEHGIAPHPSLVLGGSFVVARAFLLLNRFSFIDRFAGRPLVFNIVWKTLVYGAAAFIIRFIGFLIHALHKGEPIWAALAAAGHALDEPRSRLIAAWVVVLLIIYLTAQELVEKVGGNRMVEMFFGRHASSAEDQ